MQVSDQNQNDSNTFAEEYVEIMLQRLWQSRTYSIIDVYFRNCPREHLKDVAFIFLHHIVVPTYCRREDMN